MQHWVSEWRKNEHEELNQSVIHAIKRCLLDTLGVICKGSTYSNMPPLKEILNSNGNSYAFGLGNLEASDAALWNGTAAHSVELDDFYREGSVHPGVVVIPVALAIGQEINASGIEVLKSILIGYEVMTIVGMSAKGTLYNRGFHPTSICGVYGAAAASSYLLGLSEKQIQMAFGIAGNNSFGLMAYKSNGAWTKRLNAGWAAKTGIIAAKLAKAGFIGPDDIFEGRYGFSQAFCEEFTNDFLKSIENKPFSIEGISFKPYSSCRFTHSPIDAFLEILNEHHFELDEIEEIKVFTHKTAIEATMKPAERKYNPSTTVDAQFSIPYCLGLIAKYKKVTPEMFEETAIGDQEVLNIASKVSGYEDEAYTNLFPKQNACKLIIITASNTYEKVIMNSKGDPEYPLTDEEVKGKFINLTKNILKQTQQDEIISAVFSLESMESLNTFADILKK
ncbi:MmgE/PrpD family protein [Neobacillus niacini]|uniref:MmgE/PrpD family protein n=1 Tax=Neobacillus niacini TaxID=86668 RepID=UPI003983AC6A